MTVLYDVAKFLNKIISGWYILFFLSHFPRTFLVGKNYVRINSIQRTIHAVFLKNSIPVWIGSVDIFIEGVNYTLHTKCTRYTEKIIIP